MMNFEQVTNEYYSEWLGTDITKVQGIKSVYSNRRNSRQVGYSFKHDLICYRYNNGIIISYGDKAGDKVKSIALALSDRITIMSDIIKIIYEIYGKKPWHRQNYQFSGVVDSKVENVETRILNKSDYSAYMEHFKAVYGGDADLRDYFFDMIKRDYSHGIFIDGKLISVTDAPAMPCMCKEIQEFGVGTLSDYRGKGYAKTVCLSTIELLLKRNICPLVSVSINNTVSLKLAESLGFVKHSEELWLVEGGN